MPDNKANKKTVPMKNASSGTKFASGYMEPYVIPSYVKMQQPIPETSARKLTPLIPPTTAKTQEPMAGLSFNKPGMSYYEEMSTKSSRKAKGK